MHLASASLRVRPAATLLLEPRLAVRGAGRRVGARRCVAGGPCVDADASAYIN